MMDCPYATIDFFKKFEIFIEADIYLLLHSLALYLQGVLKISAGGF